MERLGDLPQIEGASVPIQIVELNLVGMEPITVNCGGQDTLWELKVTLSDVQQQGQMTIQEATQNGGTFDAFLPVGPNLVFTKIGDPTQVVEFDTQGLPVVNAFGLGVNGVQYSRNGCTPASAQHGVRSTSEGFCPGITGAGVPQLTILQGFAIRHGVFPAAPALEHFQCYKLDEQKFKQRRVTLNDQFKNTRTKVKSRKELCNPAKKNKEPFANKRAHLTRYEIDGKPLNTTVATHNQFGSQRFLVKKPKRLMVPTEKQERGDKRKKIRTDTDHFQCYSIKAQGGIRSVEGKPKRVTVKDQFRKKGVKVKDPKLLCTPVDKNSEGLLYPVEHLLCYAIKAKDLNKRVTIRNQFEKKNKGVRVENPKELCVPTLKQVIQQPVAIQ